MISDDDIVTIDEADVTLCESSTTRHRCEVRKADDFQSTGTSKLHSLVLRLGRIWVRTITSFEDNRVFYIESL
jgi:hypothetical protein